MADTSSTVEGETDVVLVEAEQIWALGKSIGVCSSASDEIMIHRLASMESRDAISDPPVVDDELKQDVAL